MPYICLLFQKIFDSQSSATAVCKKWGQFSEQCVSEKTSSRRDKADVSHPFLTLAVLSSVMVELPKSANPWFCDILRICICKWSFGMYGTRSAPPCPAPPLPEGFGRSDGVLEAVLQVGEDTRAPRDEDRQVHGLLPGEISLSLLFA